MISAPTAPLNGRMSKVCGAIAGDAETADIKITPTHGTLKGARVDQETHGGSVLVRVVRRADWSAGTQGSDFIGIRI
jgi:hypothetical protein